MLKSGIKKNKKRKRNMYDDCHAHVVHPCEFTARLIFGFELLRQRQRNIHQKNKQFLDACQGELWLAKRTWHRASLLVEIDQRVKEPFASQAKSVWGCFVFGTVCFDWSRK